MGWESLLFVSSPKQLSTFFRGWKPPLAVGQTHTMTNPLTGDVMTIVDDADTYEPGEAYERCDWALLGKTAPDGIGQDLTEQSLMTLAALLDVEEPALRRALSEPPDTETVVLELVPELVEALAMTDSDDHVTLGMEIREDLGPEGAAALIAKLAELAQTARTTNARLYFVEER